MKRAALNLASFAACFGTGLGILVGSGYSWPYAIVTAWAITTWVASLAVLRSRRRR